MRPEVSRLEPGADCSVVVRKLGNASGAKGVGHPLCDSFIEANWKQDEPLSCGGRRRPSLDGTSHMNREVHVRICEGCALKRNEFSGLRWPPWQSLASSHVSSLAWAGGNTHCEA